MVVRAIKSILDRLIPNPARDPPAARTLSLYLTKIARLGAYLARAKDPLPGNIVMWRGLSRLNDITLGATLQVDVVGDCKLRRMITILPPVLQRYEWHQTHL